MRSIDAMSCSGSNCVGEVVGDDEGAVWRIQFAIRNAEGIAGENARVRGIDHRVVMQRMSGRVYELELTPPEAKPLAILRRLYARGGNRQQFAV